MERHQTIEVGDATLECTLRGSGAPIVLLANAGCSVGYFDHLARALATAGFQTISINMRGVGGSLGSLDGTTLHNLAGDVAGVIEAIGCGPAHLVGHAFGNRIARCLAVDRPSLVRSVTLLAAGGLIGPPTPLGTPFRNATQVKMSGSDCVSVLGARWLSPASDPKVLEQVECWPAVHLAHLATSRNVPLEDWWSGGITVRPHGATLGRATLIEGECGRLSRAGLSDELRWSTRTSLRLVDRCCERIRRKKAKIPGLRGAESCHQ
ncbi:MAG TPA: alpha/beta hydrolase family protein [Burkholderiales bacterium]|nr:alpha/beta hydrolase family protein [Burkholderiales bacterium]